MADFDELYVDEEEEAVEDEGANRTFIILVGALGGLLALGICAFIAWALWLSPQQRAARESMNQIVQATNTALVEEASGEVAEEETVTATVPSTEETEEAEATASPTNTPRPTATNTLTATPVSTAVTTETPAEVAEASPDTPEPTVTRRPTATPRTSSDGVPDTGFGTLGIGAVGVGLLFLLILVRRMRRAL